jgi:hypothetical protein
LPFLLGEQDDVLRNEREKKRMNQPDHVVSNQDEIEEKINF